MSTTPQSLPAELSLLSGDRGDPRPGAAPVRTSPLPPGRDRQRQRPAPFTFQMPPVDRGAALDDKTEVFPVYLIHPEDPPVVVIEPPDDDLFRWASLFRFARPRGHHAGPRRRHLELVR